ncbi:plastocyanin/azurin family copper-binding protein [Halovivax sp.]|uniref:cupredoxin domain-containing protein n=1 Tax=Halovivax sp. TaxID=1935978 RepID=UPI0025C61D3F|nr:plastocyanin/azurin family copper-binding protein [Halovivax sp.]
MRGRPATRRALLASGGATLVGGLAGCVHDESEHEVGNPEPFVEVLASGDGEERFGPPVAHVVEGGTVQWVVDGGTHDSTAYHPETHRDQPRIPAGAEPWSSDPLSGDAAFDHAFETEGVYDYACTVHETRGMVGSIVVGWPAELDGEPGLSSPSHAYPAAAREQLERHTDQVRSDLEDEYERP